MSNMIMLFFPGRNDITQPNEITKGYIVSFIQSACGPFY